MEQAHHALLKGKMLSEKLNTRLVLWPLLAALVEIEIHNNNQSQAIDLYNKMVTTIDFIADSIENSKPALGSGKQLRASFLNRPDVRSALALEARLK